MSVVLGRPKLICFSSDEYTAPLPPGHAFPMSKFKESADALRASGACDVRDPGMISDIDLLRVHTPEYIRSIDTGRYNELTKLRLGLPWSVQLARRSRCATAGTLNAARVAMVHGIAANLAGGTHHAFPDRGEGYCVFNDIAVAIRALQHDEPLIQAMVIDLDAHQGNGTHFIFRDDPNVFTYSIHVGKNYPSRKEPGTLDVELPRWVSGQEYLSRLAATLPDAIERFEPDIAFFIAGVDVHADDRFGQMMLSTEDMQARDEWTINLCRGWQIPTVITYGGGYHREPRMTAKLHVRTILSAASR